MKGMPAVNWRPYLNRLAAIAVLAMVGLGGCDLSEAEGPGDRTAGHAVSGTAAQDVADDLEVAPSPTRTVEAINGHYFSACNLGPSPWLDGWFWDNAVRWRGDGSTILFSLGPVVYAAEADGSRVRMVADATTTVESGFASTAGEMTSFDVTPKGDQIVYATCAYEKNGLSEREWKRSPRHVSRYGYELAVVDVDGTEPRRLTANRLFDNYPSWSPGGERVAFLTGGLSGREGWGRYLATMAADGSQRREFEIDGKVVLHPPQWSPDETRLAVVGEVPNGRTLAIYTMRADGSDVRGLGAAASGPAWSPDGSRIAFATEEGDEIALYTMAADGTDARKVPIDPRWAPRYEGEHGVLVENEKYEEGIKKWITTLEWSPGGDRLLYTCGLRVCVVDLDGTPVGESPVDLGSGSVAAWSPDGTRIAVGLGVTWPTEDTEREYRDGDVALYSMAPDGGDLRILAVYSLSGRAGQLDVTGCVSGVAVPDPDQNPGLVGDCETLLLIRNMVVGNVGLDWSGHLPISEWTGVYVGGSPRRVQELTLRRRGLVGRIPAELSKLTQLEDLDLSYNGLVGEIPSELSSLKNLQRLDLSSNQLSGGIPPELGDLSELTELVLRGNKLHGSIPRQLGQLANLEVLDLGSNRFTGCIPAELREIESNDLHELDLPDCE